MASEQELVYMHGSLVLAVPRTFISVIVTALMQTQTKPGDMHKSRFGTEAPPACEAYKQRQSGIVGFVIILIQC